MGLELFSVRGELAKDLFGTLRSVAKMGYQAVEFYSPYFQWTPTYAREVRTTLDDLGLRCYSTHNNPESFQGDGISKAIELNQQIGSTTIVMATAGRVEGLDGWRALAARLTAAQDKFRAAGMRAGYHNHQEEFRILDGKRPIELLAAETPRDLTLQLDVGTCVEVGADPVAWIRANPGRIRSIHCKDWARGQQNGYLALVGEGACPWKDIIAAAESTGGVEYYLLEQEGSRFSELETAERCLSNWKKIRA